MAGRVRSVGSSSPSLRPDRMNCVQLIPHLDVKFSLSSQIGVIELRHGIDDSESPRLAAGTRRRRWSPFHRPFRLRSRSTRSHPPGLGVTGRAVASTLTFMHLQPKLDPSCIGAIQVIQVGILQHNVYRDEIAQCNAILYQI